MELKEFVKQALVEITKGVSEAQEDLKDTGAIVNPSLIYNDRIDEVNGKRSVSSIKFNVGVTLEDKDNVKSGLGVLTGFFSVGASTASEGTSKSVTSIEFVVPLALPCSDGLKGRNKAVRGTLLKS